MSRHERGGGSKEVEVFDPERLAVAQRDIGREAVDRTVVLHGSHDVVPFGKELALPESGGKEVVPYEGAQNLPTPYRAEQGVLRIRDKEQRQLPPALVGEKPGPITVGHIDLSDNANRKAYDIADRRIEDLKEANSKRFLLNPKRIARNIWGYNAKHRKVLNQARKDIFRAQDVNIVDEEFDEAARKRYGEAIFDQFFNGSDEAIDTAAGENREFFAADHDATLAMRKLYAEYASRSTEDHPLMTDDEFNRRVGEIRELMGEHESETATGEVEQDNYLEAARAVRGRIEHGEAIDEVLEGFQLVRGESRADARTEVHQTKVEKLLDKYEKTRLGELVPSNVMAVGVSVGAFAATRGASTAAKLAFFAGGASVTGAIAGVRESGDISKQRARRERETFRGKEFVDSTKREKALSEFEYERASVEQIKGRLGDFKDKLESGEHDETTVKEAIDELANIKLLKELSASRGIDLFDHGVNADPTKHLKDRLEVAQSQAELKNYLQKALQEGDATVLDAMGLDASDVEDEATIRGLVDAQVNDRVAVFEEVKLHEIDEKDTAFRKYRRREAFKKGASVAAFSLVGGVVAHEAIAMVSSQSAGLAERAWGGNNSTSAHDTALNKFIGRDEVRVSHTHENLSPDKISELRSQGSEVLSNNHTDYDTVTRSMNLDEYKAAHPEQLRHFNNVTLFDNNSSAPDQNELGGQLTRNPDGGVRVWDTMSQDGSFTAAGERLDMTNAQTNDFVMAFENPDGTHDFKVFEYGQEVPKPYADMLYQKDDGSWGFKGDGYVAWGQTSGDTLNVAASIGGDGGANTFTDVEKVPHVTYDYEIRTPVDRPLDVPPAVWSPGRSRLGNARRPQVEQPSEAEPSTELDRKPVMQEPSGEPSKELERATREPAIQEKTVTGAALESRERQVAREAGWPLLDIRIGTGQNISTEQWQLATSFVEQAKSELADDDEVAQLRRAAEMAIDQGADASTAGLLSTLYVMNENKERGNGARAETESSSSQRSGEAANPRVNTEADPQEVAGRISTLAADLDAVVSRESREAAQVGLTPEVLRQARGIYENVIRQRGASITNKTLARRAAAEVHPDRIGEEDGDLSRAINWINERLRDIEN